MTRVCINRYNSPSYNRIYLCQRGLKGAYGDPEDIAQDAWVEALTDIDTGVVNNTDGFGSYMRRKTTWRGLSQVRRLQLERRMNANGSALEILSPGMSDRHSVDIGDEAISHIMSGQVREAVNGLSPILRTTMVLFYFQGLSRLEVAERLSIPEGTVASRVNKALKKLRAAMNVDPA